MGDREDPAQSQANEVAKILKGPVQGVIQRVERLAEEFPADKDFHFYNNFPQFKTPVHSIRTQATDLLNGVGLANHLRPQTAGFPSDLDEAYDWLVAVQDDLMEGIDAAVDQMAKQKSDGKRGRPIESFRTPTKFQKSDGSPSEGAKASRGSDERRPVPFHVRSIPRPQNKFDVMVDNSNTPFKHPQVPKSDSKSEGLSALDLHARRLGVTFEDMHPLEDVLMKMEYVNEKMLEAPVPQEPRPVDETPLTVISTVSELKDMAMKCRLAGEIAVDLENHNYRSFQGFVCLMQVSTRSEDFIVDTLALRSHIGPSLKDLFADANVKKVMHGADRDVEWLQRDFGIYVCNMFDTGQAARVLQLEGFGLAFLMQHFLKISPDKRYQLADWRIRPLPAEMIKYAREDTHYLLYLYDLLRVELVSMRSAECDVEDPVLQVYKRSRDICLKMYKKEILTETSYLSLYGLQDKNFNTEQIAVLAGLYAWRDNLARKLDESTGFVLPNQLLYKLAEEMPDSARTLQIAIRGPHSVVGQHTAEVLEVIRQSKEKAATAAPSISLAVPERIECKETSVTEAVVSSNSRPEIVNKITCRNATKTIVSVSTNVPDRMEEDAPVSVNGEDVDMKLAYDVNYHAREQGNLDLLSSAGNDSKPGKTGIICTKQLTAGSSMSAQVMVRRSSAEDIKPASTSNVNAAVVRRASAPSLALFGGGSKKTSSTRSIGLKTETKAVKTSAKESSPNSRRSLTDPEAANCPSASEAVTVASLSTSLDIASGSVENGEESMNFSKGKVLAENGEVSNIQERLNEVFSTSTTLASLDESHNSEDVIMGVTDADKASETNPGNLSVSEVNPSRGEAVLSKPTDQSVAFSKSCGTARHGLGSILGSSGHRKRQKRQSEDMEMVAAKLRASRIQASVALAFHRAPTLIEQNAEITQETSTVVSAATGSEPSNILSSQTSSPNEVKASSIQGDSLLEDLGDYVKIGSSEREFKKGLNKNRSNRLNEFASEEETPLPKPLSEIRRHQKHQHREHQALSSDAPRPKHQQPEAQKHSAVEANEVFAAEEAGFKPFDYGVARREIGLGDNLVSRKDDGEASRGRGRGRPVNPNKRQKQLAPPSTKGPVQPFDPLRRVRQEPRPEGIPAAKRRQVFPQSGNRTASFKR